ncbi:hypothetical protein AMJ39_04315 [candidate division TA06 bacterium DG_24]|uniref:NADH dehydrogenase n=2 Tax=Bacteria division TA06 TaxID=1156500 RepID=A0A0S8JP10_UNCT6|nr:MAG: hypothetical protein AMJ39_04315 [candidate division TA06 bacterium DG_24]KPL10556.1 MAG: hypothetical protein AMJ71_02815 [candidate division TA06 bacterium SM1_40]
MDRGGEKKERLTIIVFSGDLDKVQAAFTIATGAASMDMDVTLFFTFWGLNVVRRTDVRTAGRGLLQKMMKIMNRGGPQRLPLSRFNMFGMGPRMMKKLMAQFKMPGIDEMIRLAKEMGVKLVACTVTMEVMGITKEEIIPDVDAFAGVTTYLADARGSAVNLFI